MEKANISGRLKLAGLICVAWFLESLRQGIQGIGMPDALYRALGYLVPISALALAVAALMFWLFRKRLPSLPLTWAMVLIAWTACELVTAVFNK